MFEATTEVIGASAATESGIASAMAAGAAAKAPMLLGALPMGNDPASVAFAAALNARGATFLAAHGMHAANRELFSSVQSLNADTIAATEAIRAAMAAL
ncbi:PE family protein (plasmid) [Mycobacterium paragordonae]|nr:PE domain-containing protein [Mycobacterium paragordonae]AYE99554.1 PE family protein [Mycobacterium paragordonae]